MTVQRPSSRPFKARPLPARTGPKQRLQMTQVGKKLDDITRKAFNKFGFADDHVLKRWPEIVGPELARLTSPERLSRPQKGAATGSVLTVRVAGAAALEMQHMAPAIIDRINGFYGRPQVARLKLVQGPLPAHTVPVRRKLAGAAKPAVAVDPSSYEIEDSDLADALARLERAVAAGQE